MTEPNDNLRDRPDVLQERRDRWDHIADSEDQLSLRELAVVPLKRKRIVMTCAILGLLAAIFITIVMTPRYRATATIELNEDKQGGVSAISDIASMATGGADELKVKIQTESAVIEDDSIALAVMGKMGMLRLAKPGWFSKEQGPVVGADALPAKRREQLIQGFEANLKVKEVENSRLIAITYTSTDPVQAANIANQIVAEYKTYLLNSNFSSSEEVSQWLTGQLGGLSDRVTKSEQAVADYERSHNLSAAMPGLVSLGGGSSGVSPGSSEAGGGESGGGGIHIPELERLTALNEEVTEAEAKRLAAEAIYRMTETQNPDVISSLGSSSLPGLSNSTVISQGGGLEMLNALREQEATIKVTYADAASKYGNKNPRLTEIESQLESIDDQIRTEMGKIKQRAKNDLTLAEENEKALQVAYQAQKKVTSKMNDDVLQLGILMEQARSTRELYDLLFAKLQEAEIDSGSSAVDVTVADPARPPGTPWIPKRSLFPALGLFGGLIFGVSLAYLQESQDDTLADSMQIEELAHVPVLSIVPYHKRDVKEKPGSPFATESSPFLTDPGGATAESFRSLRSGLALSEIGRAHV